MGYLLFLRFVSWSYMLASVMLTVAVLVLIGVLDPIDKLALERLYAMLAAAVLAFALAGTGVLYLWFFDRPLLEELQQG